MNVCPSGATCRSFEDVFDNATYFCEHVFGPGDYRVIDDSMQDDDALCLKFNFTGTNPNTKVRKSTLTCAVTNLQRTLYRSAILILIATLEAQTST